VHDRLRRRWAANIKAARKAKGMSQFDFAEQVGVDQTTVSRWERGKAIPTENSKVRIGEVVEADARELFPLTLDPADPAEVA
jgi:transcriptional regulator with XRE-family HTH domain